MAGMTGREFRARVRAAGSHWFDPGAVSFFRSRFYPETLTWAGPDRAYFVSSEQFDDDAPRLYSVRVAVFTPDGEGVDVSDAEGHRFQEYSSLSAAAVALGRTVAAWRGEIS